MSLVLVCPSTEMQLNDSSTASARMPWRSAAATAASVRRNPSIVAILGPIIAAPLAIPSRVTSPPPTVARRATSFGRESVVRIARDAARKADSPAESPVIARSSPSRSRSIGN